eukprot:TRINITY_DN10180_c0_g2_i1.p1 TRINITY_DN10180_c0_g2~~TRINITY_DN10180_c0_g2_i1.p1  ORF type:complete len:316 (+),score=51.00 TRINITY_DN10180_c0_g2_i1:80-949(+)
MDNEDVPHHVQSVSLYHTTLAGLTSGVIQAGLFNPWDRALYLAVQHRRNFLMWDNFTSPFRGFCQAVVQRTLSGGLYFVLQDLCKGFVKNFRGDEETSVFDPFMIGCTAGALNGMLLNQLAVVKYQAWNDRNGISFLGAVRHLYKNGGTKVFFKGMWVTGARDMIFGSTYEVVRIFLQHSFPKKDTFLGVSSQLCSNLVAGCVATVLSSPVNYVRTMKYSTPAHENVPSALRILADLWKSSESPTLFRRTKILQDRLKIGWGTARVGCGMAFGQYVFDRTKFFLETWNS